eukprot:m.30190 g.30190  ORF g.30190 m.30190 type:complete len:482 (+) comp9621_c0_seq3:40-1485(+)
MLLTVSKVRNLSCLGSLGRRGWNDRNNINNNMFSALATTPTATTRGNNGVCDNDYFNSGKRMLLLGCCWGQRRFLGCGLVGLANVGKSSLFNAVVGSIQSARAENFPFCTIDPNVALVPIPDVRLDTLGVLNNSRRVVQTQLNITDIAGLVKGAHEGAGLGNKFLANIRECDMIVHVVRGFLDDDVTHVEGSVDVLRDVSIISLELVLSDLAQVERRLDKLKKMRTAEALEEKELLSGKVLPQLNEGLPVRRLSLSEREKQLLRSLQLLTTKPSLFAVNIAEEDLVIAPFVREMNLASSNTNSNCDEAVADDADDGNNNRSSRIDKLTKFQQELVNIIKTLIEEEGEEVVCVSAELESQLHSLSQEERLMYIEELGLREADVGASNMIRSAYQNLRLITFYTSGPTETRAWTIQQGTNAKDAAGKIHTDISNRFIKADTINFNQLQECESMEEAYRAGLVRSEGKEYIVKDGDVILFKHNA